MRFILGGGGGGVGILGDHIWLSQAYVQHGWWDLGGYVFDHGVGTIIDDVMLVCIMNLINDRPGPLGLLSGSGPPDRNFVHILIDINVGGSGAGLENSKNQHLYAHTLQTSNLFQCPTFVIHSTVMIWNVGRQ